MDLLSGTDKALLARAARRAEDTALALASVEGPGWNSVTGKEAKRIHDRLQLDALALRALSRRLDVQVPEGVKLEP